MTKVRRLYRSGHYYNGQGISYGGYRLKNGYFNMKVNSKHITTHRAIAWLWPRDGRRPVMPWMLDVDHMDNNYTTFDFTQLRWITRQTHNGKHKTKKKNNGNSKRIRGRLEGSDDWQVFPSLSEGVRQTGCRMDGVSNCANGKQKKTNAKDGNNWVWEWCKLEADRDQEEWRTCVLPDGTVVPHLKVSNMGMIMKNDNLKTPGYPDGGYLKIRIGDSFLVHRIVASTWDRLPQKHEVCDHIDGDKTNNRISNLRWVTSAVNNENCDRPTSYPSIATSVQPFFDSSFTDPAHDPFSSQNEAAAFYGLKASTAIRNALEGRAATSGKFKGRKLYWKRTEHDYGPSADVNDDLAAHLEQLKSKKLRDRLREEDAKLGTPILEAAGEGQTLFFEELGGSMLRFYTDENTCLGDARCANIYQLTARRVEGVWRVYEF